ncbi:MAG: glycosyltransferase [Methylovulum sp.]|nr:glycosyltransferase [Methylovulum sp.]
MQINTVHDPKELIESTKREGGMRFKGVKKESQPHKPLITIITATFNAAEHLPHTIKSIRELTYDNIQWIVVDGASKDSTVELIQQNEDVIDYWISEPDTGIADAWNKGLKLTTGDGVLILNAGDTYTKDAISLLSNSFHPKKITCASSNIVTKEGKVIDVFRARPWKLWYGMHVPHNWCLVPTAFYIELGGYPEIKYSMDFSWFYNYYRQYGTDGFIVLDDILGNYSLGGISDIHSFDGFKTNARIMVKKGCSPFIAWSICFVYAIKHYVYKWLNT